VVEETLDSLTITEMTTLEEVRGVDARARVVASEFVQSSRLDA
jgi:hypothetical protein